ncbi:MAG: hypothetical protein DLD55_00075 [candidate division SR1 bacterium]|nr:MAG: hypothetical protein DLD55_00075 [candidate division SR1 bacterium]
MNELQAKFLAISEEQAKSIQEQLSSLEIKGEDSNRKFRVVASTEDIDRSGEVIKLDGWDFENYKKNPVVIANHIYRIENIVGRATKIGIEDGRLVIEGVFSKSNPLGILLADLYDEGMVKTVSVGFIPKQRQEDNRRIITSAELLELSFVAVPCNPEALSLDQKELIQKGIEAGILQLEKKEEPEQKSELEAFKAEILGEIHEVKALLQAMVDGNTKQKDEANIIAKETLQSIVRAGNEGLAMFKKAVRGG